MNMFCPVSRGLFLQPTGFCQSTPTLWQPGNTCARRAGILDDSHEWTTPPAQGQPLLTKYDH